MSSSCTTGRSKTGLVIFLGLWLLKYNVLIEIVYNMNVFVNDENSLNRSKYKVYPNTLNARDSSLQHLHTVLERLGYEISSKDWDLFWSQESDNFRRFLNLSLSQKVNEVPGTNTMKMKVLLSGLESKYIPKTFRLPAQRTEFLEYAAEENKTLFLRKGVNHRGIRLITVDDVKYLSNKYFIQEFVQNPLLVDGHKFDIGVYVVITSMNPLRVYWYKGDVQFRYCPVKYHPLDPKNTEQYVVADNYIPTWNLPSLAESFSAHKHSIKNSFDIYIESKGVDSRRFWIEIQKAVSEIFILQENLIAETSKAFHNQENFFELLRLDFLLDASFKIYLLEINFSPNLSSVYLPLNGLLFEQLLYNVFLLTGIAFKSNVKLQGNEASDLDDMITSQKHITVLTDKCYTVCSNCSVSFICKLCKPCMDDKFKKSLLKAHQEFMSRGDFRRAFPPNARVPNLKNLSRTSKLQYLWYKEKCKLDNIWCT